MIRIHHIVKASALAAAMLLGAQAQAQTLTNGTFDSNLNGWTQPAGSSVDWSGFGTAFFNSRDDVLRQVLGVIGGQQYDLTFSYLSSGATGNGLRVDFNGVGFNPAVVGYAATNGAVFTGTYTFTATATGDTTLRFLGVRNGFTHLDNVSVTAVPEPETYAMMLAGLGAVGFMARRRKFKQS